MKASQTFVISDQLAGQRLDQVAAQCFNISRSQALRALEAGHLLINDTLPTKAGLLVAAGDELTLNTETTSRNDADRPSLQLSVVYEDPDLMIVDKPAGVLTHPVNSAKPAPSVADFVRQFTADQDSLRPGIVHRLDRDTSGLVIVAKTLPAKAYLQKAFKAHKVRKTYTALVSGRPTSAQAIIDLPIGRSRHTPIKRTVSLEGRLSRTEYKVMRSFGKFSLIEVWPQTGRTHQIRVHLAHIGHPIVGDQLYDPHHAKLVGVKRQFLHASRVQLIGPSGQHIDVSSPLPPDLTTALTALEGGND